MQIAEKFKPGMRRQLEDFSRALDSGMPRRGWKVAINVPEVLKHLDLPHSGVAWIDGRQVLASGDAYTSPPDARLLIEPEIAIHLETTVPSGSGLKRARESIGAISPALEIVNYTHPGAEFDDVVATRMFHAATVLGQAQPLEKATGLGQTWPQLSVGETRSEAPRPDLVPRDLGELVAFVSEYLAYFGERLEAGDLILSGSYTAQALAIAPGERATANHGPLGDVSVRIEP